MYYKTRPELENKIIFGKAKGPQSDNNKFVEINDSKKIEEIDELLGKGYEIMIDDQTNIIQKILKKIYGISSNESKKSKIIEKLNSYLTSRVNNHSLIDYIDYIDCRDELAEKGYIITDSNKEEKYLEILETEDDELIDLLETFLISKDNLKSLKTARKTYRKLLEELKSTPEDDNEALEEINRKIPQ